MYEGKPPDTQEDDGSGRPAAVGQLREISWGDLRSRLEAARDLRTTIDEREVDRLTSFDAHSARCIAARSDGKDHLNPNNLSHGKGPGGMNSFQKAVAPARIRENR